jgi:ATP-independent RNA helicase DbpA
MEADFRSLALSAPLLQVVEELGFTKLTAIQAQAIPVLLARHDLIGQSQTGSGKTAAFALPILERLRIDRQRALQALVLCPTRELCAQVARDTRRLGRRHPGLQVLSLAGGEPMRAQMYALERGVHIVVGTPGRVLDHLRRGSLQLQDLSTLVLDEADRMLDMGFQDDMEQILECTPAGRQTVFFSATFPRSIEAMSAKYQRAPVRVTIEDSAREQPNISQWYVEVEQPNKLAALRRVLDQHAHEAALVFANLKVSVAEVEQALLQAGLSVGCLHGDLMQSDRDRVLAMFRNGSTRVLIATDVAARGIDVENLDLVINYDLPTRFDVYLHRVGRTGRAGKAGVAISLVTARERARVSALEEALGVSLERLPRQPAASARAPAIDADASGAEIDVPSPQPTAAAPQAAAMETLRISGGRKQKVRPADILGALTGEAGGLAGTEIGKIEIHDHFSYVAVAKRVSRQAHRGLSEGRIKGRRFSVALVK